MLKSSKGASQKVQKHDMRKTQIYTSRTLHSICAARKSVTPIMNWGKRDILTDILIRLAAFYSYHS